jgi:hypothetical protein
MKIFVILFPVFGLLSLTVPEANCQVATSPSGHNMSQSDADSENQNLLNGRIWKNLYYMVENTQFLFSNQFLPGSVTMRGKTFNNQKIKYDIFKDEILTPYNPDGVLQINKELVDSFSILFQDRKYQFTHFKSDSLKDLGGYVNVLYNSKSALYVKYSKKIDRQKVEGEYDKFYQLEKVLLVINHIVYPVSGKSDLLRALSARKELVRDFVRTNKISISNKDPGSYVPVVRYFDSVYP